MAYFNRDNRSSDRRSFGNDRAELHSAVCANCGKNCEVPFKPTGNKPVLCRDCFKNAGGPDSRRSDAPRSFGPRSNSGDRPMYDAVCSNCGDKCQIPFQPSQGRDVFCSNCFEKNQGQDSHRPERRNFKEANFSRNDSPRTHDQPNYKAQFEALSAKMDKILALLDPKVAPLESVIDEKVIEELVEEVKEVKEPKVKKVAAKKKTVKKASPKKKK